MKKVGILLGSLRQGSFNKKVSEKIIELLPEGFEGRFIKIDDVPFFNDDIDKDGLRPESYDRLRREVGEMDAILLVTPEYNRAPSAVIKNAVDVLSRPHGANSWTGKKVAIISASTSGVAGIKANHSLRDSMLLLGANLIPGPEMLLGSINSCFDEEGKMVDRTVEFLQAFVDRLVNYVG